MYQAFSNQLSSIAFLVKINHFVSIFSVFPVEVNSCNLLIMIDLTSLFRDFVGVSKNREKMGINAEVDVEVLRRGKRILIVHHSRLLNF